ncbi:MAG: Ig-like domain repeat protein [Pseudonocardiaceae bacterium]
MPRVPSSTVAVGHHTAAAGRATRISTLAVVLAVVLATLMALLAPVPVAAVVPGTNGLIAFTSSRDSPGSGRDIYVMNADGTNPTNLTNNPAFDSDPDWGVLATQLTATTTTLDVTPASPVAASTSETLRARVTPSGAAGRVQFKDGPTNIDGPVNVSGGTASMTTTLAPGTHSLTAVFTPTDTTKFGSSTSAAVSYVVNAPTGTKATTTTLTVFPKRAFEGIPVVFLAQVAPRGAAGTVQFVDGTTTLGAPVRVTGGFALLITPLPPGTHSLIAEFTPTGPAAFASSTSPSVSLTVNSLLRLR